MRIKHVGKFLKVKTFKKFTKFKKPESEENLLKMSTKPRILEIHKR